MRSDPLDRFTAMALALAAMVLTGLATRHGPGLSIDSVNYLASGVNLADDQRMAMLADQPLTIFPPGLPALAAAGELVGIEGQDLLRVVMIVCFGGIVLVGNRLVRVVTDQRFVIVAATLLIAVAPALFEVTATVRSEPPFILAVLASLALSVDLWTRRAAPWRTVAGLVLLCWAAFLLRYAGVVLIATGATVLARALWPLDRSALVRIGTFGLAASTVPVAVMLRNHAADGTWLGLRMESHDSVQEIASRTFATFGRWLLPVDDLSEGGFAVVGALGVAIALAAAIAAVRATRERPARAGMLVCGLFCLIYVAYLSYASYTALVLPTGSRYLSPAYVPAVVVLAGAIGHLMRTARPIAGGAAAAVAGALVVGQVASYSGDVRTSIADGIAYNTDTWLDSELAAATTEAVARDDDAVVYSNEPFGLWAATRLQPLQWAPRDIQFRGGPLTGELEAFEQTVDCAGHTVYLAYYLVGSPRVMDLRDIREAVRLEPVARTRDGVLLRAEPSPTGACDPPDLRPTRAR